MRLRKKPKKPVRKKDVKKQIGEFYPDSLDGMGIFANGTVEASIDLSSHLYAEVDVEDYTEIAVEFNEGYDDGYYSESASFTIYGYCDESDAEFTKRVKYYERRSREYDEWYAANKDEIDAELEKRSREKEDRKDKQKQIKKLEKQLRDLRRG